MKRKILLTSILTLSCLLILFFIILIIKFNQQNTGVTLSFKEKQTVTETQSGEQYEYILVYVSYKNNLENGLELKPSDFTAEINNKKIEGQHFLAVEVERFENMEPVVGVFKQNKIKLERDKVGSFKIYFGCSLNELSVVYYKNAPLPNK